MFHIKKLKSGDKFYCVEELELFECEVVSGQNGNCIDIIRKDLHKDTYHECCLVVEERAEYYQFRKEAEQVRNRNVAIFLLEISNQENLLKKLYKKAFQGRNNFEDIVNAVLYQEVINEIVCKN